MWPFLNGLKHGIILASASPRRAAIFRQMGFPFKQVPSKIEEEERDASPAEFARQMACAKAKAIGDKRTNSIVIGCDTVVVLDGKIFGKPRNSKEAMRMLSALNGKCHQVCSGIAVAFPGRRMVSGVETTKVLFRKLEKKELQWYVNTGEPLDKAGAYGIQGKGAVLVKRIEGCYYNVVGFPLSKFAELMKKCNLGL